jgi:hypothetical protein
MKKETKRKLIDVLDEIAPEDLAEAEDIVKRDRALRNKKSDWGM